MPNVMIRAKPDGNLLFYIAKKDQEEQIARVECDSEERWGGEVELIRCIGPQCIQKALLKICDHLWVADAA